MNRNPLRAPLSTLLSALLLVACGDTAETVPAPAEEALGTEEAALCAGLSVPTLTIAGASIYEGLLAASGSWAVSSGANAVRLEYYVNNVLYTSEERTGTSGTWYFSTAGLACGANYTLLVKAFPMVIDSGGNRTTCWSAPKTTSTNVSEPCPGGHWQFITQENCYYWTMMSCYYLNLQPVCPSSPAGKPCTTIGSYCYRVLNDEWAEEYQCQ
jgi:hypothetical protein